MAVADFPLLGMRTRMMVSVLVDTSSPARKMANSSADSGLPCASVLLSMPTSRMSMAPSSPPPPSDAEEMWLMPDSNERILLQATPVPRTTTSAETTATVRTRRPGISPGYWRGGRRAGRAGRRARLFNHVAEDRDHRGRRPGRLRLGSSGHAAGARRARPDVVGVRRHRRDGARAAHLRG